MGNITNIPGSGGVIPQEGNYPVSSGAPLQAAGALTTDSIAEQSKSQGPYLSDLQLARLLAGDPVLVKGRSTGQVSPTITAADWFSPSPLATYMTVLLALVEVMKSEKKEESKIFQLTVDLTLEMTQDIKASIIASAEKQAEIHKLNATMAYVNAGISGVQGIATVGAFLKSPANITATSQAIGAGATFAQNITRGIQEGITAGLTVEKGALDARTEELRSIKQIVDSLLNEALQAEKDASGGLKELINAFRQMVKEHMQAHSFR
jgi:hypothetical protein